MRRIIISLVIFFCVFTVNCGFKCGLIKRKNLMNVLRLFAVCFNMVYASITLIINVLTGTEIFLTFVVLGICTVQICTTFYYFVKFVSNEKFK